MEFQLTLTPYSPLPLNLEAYLGLLEPILADITGNRVTGGYPDCYPAYTPNPDYKSGAKGYGVGLGCRVRVRGLGLEG
jgi:hypothetical protein